jgi:hypothetical protein
MKKIFFIFLATLMISSSAFALTNHTVNTCQLSVSLFGFVKVWTGSITTYDDQGNILSQTGCGISGGSWDWFWE